MNIRILRLAAAVVAAPLLLLAAVQADTPLLLSATSYPPAQLLPPPPADGSPVQRAELAEIRQVQATMTPDAYAAADRDGKTENASIFAVVLGPAFDLSKLPKTAALMATVRVEEKTAVRLAKGTFGRNRPWVLDPAIRSCTRNDDPQSSYPSGHATMAYSMAVVLAAMVPEKASALFRRAQLYAENRIVCGVHYRSDIVAGQVFGTVIAEKLLANPQFLRDFETARTELLAALAAAH